MIRRLQQEEKIPYDLLLLADEERSAIEKYIHDSEIYVIEKGKSIIAVYALYGIDSQTLEIKNIAVQPEYQGQGLGKQMIQDAVQRARSAGYKTILIGTGDASTRQLALYQREGFEIDSIKHNFFLENYGAPIFENGNQLKHMIMLKLDL